MLVQCHLTVWLTLAVGTLLLWQMNISVKRYNTGVVTEDSWYVIHCLLVNVVTDGTYKRITVCRRHQPAAMTYVTWMTHCQGDIKQVMWHMPLLIQQRVWVTFNMCRDSTAGASTSLWWVTLNKCCNICHKYVTVCADIMQIPSYMVSVHRYMWVTLSRCCGICHST